MLHTVAVQDNGGLWDASAAPAAAAAAAGAAATVGGSSSHSPSQLGLPVWVWNGLHAYAPSAAAVLVEALDLLTSSISVGLQQVTAAAPAAAAPGSNDHMGQQQQEVLPPALPDKQQHVSVVEQRWRVAQLALLAAAATTLTALKNGTGPVTTLHEQQLGVPNGPLHSQGQEPPPAAGPPADTVAAGQAAPAAAAPGPSTSTAPAVAGAEMGVAGQFAGLPETGGDTQQQVQQDSLPGLQQQQPQPQPQSLMQQLAPGAVPADPPVQQQQQTLPGDPQQPGVSAVPQPMAAAAVPGDPGAAPAAPPAGGGPAPGAGGTSQQQPSQQLGAQTVAA